MLIIKAKNNQYVKNGNPVFVYTLTGTKEELKAFKDSQGDNYRENEGKEPLYFTQRVCQPGQELSKTQSGRYQVLQDLEAKVLAIDTAAEKTIGKLKGMVEYFGISKAQLQQQMIAALAE